jgi:hypothetical protein
MHRGTDPREREAIMAQATTKEPLSEDVTNEQVQMLVAERKKSGATAVTIVVENGVRVIVTEWPAL